MNIIQIIIVLCEFVSGLILHIFENLRFDDLHVEWLRDKLKFIFSPDIIVCGWLGSKYQRTN